MDQFFSQYVAALCHKVFTCCDAAEIAAFRSMVDPTIVDEASCEASSTAMSGTQLALEQYRVDAGLATYHGDRARACVDAESALTCSTWGGLFGMKMPPACAGVLVGALADGSPCYNSEDCASGYCGDTATGQGACVAPVKLGERCELAPCASGLTCVSDPSSGGPNTCGHEFPDGSPCLYDADCQSGICSTTAATNGVCTPPETTCTGT